MKTEKNRTEIRSMKSGKKSWTEKLLDPNKQPEIKKIEKDFADIPAGARMLIATPQIIDSYVKQIPKGKSVSLQTMRNDLAQEYSAEYTCPVTSGIFLRIVAEAAHEQWKSGKALNKITPFWRVVASQSPLNKKLTFGADFVEEQRRKEKLDDSDQKARQKK